MSRRTPRCSAASARERPAIAPNASQSVRASHGGGIAWLNECTNGCMSVIDRSYFSYQVAAGSTTSEYRPRRRHAEVDVDQQVELAARDLVAPAHVRRALAGSAAARPAARRASAPEQVAQEVLLALARGAEQVRAPDEEHAREARRRARVVDREAAAGRPCSSATTCSTASTPAASASSARSSGLRSNFGKRRHPAHPHRLGVRVDRRLAGEQARGRAARRSAPGRSRS